MSELKFMSNDQKTRHKRDERFTTENKFNNSASTMNANKQDLTIDQ